MAKNQYKKIDPQLIANQTEDGALKLFLNARGFDLAARIIDRHTGNKSLLMWPMEVNEALALELYLKCLHLIRGIGTLGHDTEDFFDKLSKADQIAIDQYLLEIVKSHRSFAETCDRGVRFDAKSVAQRAKNMFEKGRYWWEGKLPTPDSDGFVTNAGIGNLCDAIRKRIIDLNPSWVTLEPNMRFKLPGQGLLPS